MIGCLLHIEQTNSANESENPPENSKSRIHIHGACSLAGAMCAIADAVTGAPEMEAGVLDAEEIGGAANAARNRRKLFQRRFNARDARVWAHTRSCRRRCTFLDAMHGIGSHGDDHDRLGEVRRGRRALLPRVKSDGGLKAIHLRICTSIR